MPRPSERVSFPGSEGHELSGRIERALDGSPQWAIFAHCFTCTKDALAATRVSRRLAAHGFNVLRFDFTGLGESEGAFGATSLSSNVADLAAAADYLRREHAAPALLVGHSLGGAAALAAAGDIPELRALAVVAAPSTAAHVIERLGVDPDELARDGAVEVRLGGAPFKIGRRFIEDLSRHDLAADARALDRPLLIAHAPADDIVGIEHASALFTAARHPKSFLSLDDADHMLSRAADAAYLADVLAAWASRYVEPRPLEPGLAADVVVRETGAGRYVNEVIAGERRFLVDEPEAVGGDDAGPDPYALLSAALGACTTITLRMYADRKGLPVERITAGISHRKGHAEDCEACDEAQKAHVDVFEREIQLSGPLSPEQRARLLEIADKCPVHRTLQGPAVVRTRWVSGEEAG